MNRSTCPRASRCIVAATASAVLTLLGGAASAASSTACTSGGFSALGQVGRVKIDQEGSQLPAVFAVKGRYVEFEVVTATLAIRNYVLTGAANPLDMTGGVRTPIFESKVPDITPLSGRLRLEARDGSITIERGDGAVKMKIQAKDCAQGGVFQMEVEREDGQATLFTHTLASIANGNLAPFYFDNRLFRDREGDVVPYGTTTMTVPARVNFGNDFSPKFVGRDSAQLASRRAEPACTNGIVNRYGAVVSVRHCGGVSRWDVRSGGRMGMVLGGDAVEVAPAATDCAADCQAQNQVQGQALVLGFPFPVAPADRLQPRQP